MWMKNYYIIIFWAGLNWKNYIYDEMVKYFEGMIIEKNFDYIILNSGTKILFCQGKESTCGCRAHEAYFQDGIDPTIVNECIAPTVINSLNGYRGVCLAIDDFEDILRGTGIPHEDYHWMKSNPYDWKEAKAYSQLKRVILYKD